MRLQTHNGDPVTLGAEIGKGGEGRVTLVEGAPSLVAKIYHRITDARIKKLSAMLANPPDDPMAGKQHISIAWPVSLLGTTGEHPAWVGYLMPRVAAMRPVFEFYNPGIRRQRCPFFDYGYLNQTAMNLSAAMHALHTRGYVIGDVNESNIFVADSALVTIVDTDSFQVNDTKNGVVHRCPVGKLEFTPPELQGMKFADINRAPEHDLFGLGVLIYQLLMEGAHPFAGRYLGQGDPPSVEQRISSGHFPHGPTGAHYAPLPSGLPFCTLNPSLQQLFLQCFVEGYRNPKARPDALTWHSALQGGADALRQCRINTHHRHSGHLTTCPWCERRQQLGGRDAFPSEDAVRTGSHLRPSAQQTSTTRPAHSSSNHGWQAPRPSVATAQVSPETSSVAFSWHQLCLTLAAWWSSVRRMVVARPYISVTGLAVAVLLTFIVVGAMHRGTVNKAYRNALSVAEYTSAPDAGIAALQTVLMKYPDARQATYVRNRSAKLIESIFTAAFKRADAAKDPEAAIKEIEGVMSKYPASDQIERARNKIVAVRTEQRMRAEADEAEQKRQDKALDADITTARSHLSAGTLEQVEALLTKALKENPRASRAPDAQAVIEEATRMLAVWQRAEDIWPAVRKDAEWVLSMRSEKHPVTSLLLSFTFSERANWKRAADGGCAEAQLLMGWCYDLGVGSISDQDMAAKYYGKAAEQGNAWAQLKLSLLNRTTLTDEYRAAWLRRSAGQGLRDAQELLGSFYFDGILVQKDRAQAAKWFRKAAEQGCPAAQCALGYILINSAPQEAVTWFRKAANQDVSTAQNNLGVMYAAGKGIQRDASEALRWIAKASENENGHIVPDSDPWDIDRNLAFFRENSSDTSKLVLMSPNIQENHRRREVWSFHNKKEEPLVRRSQQTPSEPSRSSIVNAPTSEDYKRRTKDTKPSLMVEYVRQCAELGVPEAQADLAQLCASGDGVPKDDQKAFEWLRKAADQGNAQAQTEIGRTYYNQKDYAEAALWCRIAAEQGTPFSQWCLGRMYEEGNGLPQDYAEAVKWYRKAANQGYPSGEYFLGNMYLNGTGVPQDNDEASKWYRKAAEQGHVPGQWRLGCSYYWGKGVPKDDAEAVKFFQKAADQGFAPAQVNLGSMYYQGWGVPKDDAMAEKWLRKASEQGWAEGQYQCGLIVYDGGHGVQANPQEAIRLFRLAAEQGHSGAKQRLAELGE